MVADLNKTLNNKTKEQNGRKKWATRMGRSSGITSEEDPDQFPTTEIVRRDDEGGRSWDRDQHWELDPTTREDDYDRRNSENSLGRKGAPTNRSRSRS